MRFLSFFGWSSAILGAASTFLCILTLIEGDPKHKGAPYGFAMLAILFGLPGTVILWRLRDQRRAQEFRAQLLGYIKSLDSFNVEELAAKIGKPQMEAERLVATLIQAGDVDLVFHRKTRQYMHRKRLQTKHRELERCPSCGASLRAQILFEGENGACQYCDHPLAAPAAE